MSERPRRKRKVICITYLRALYQIQDILIDGLNECMDKGPECWSQYMLLALKTTMRTLSTNKKIKWRVAKKLLDEYADEIYKRYFEL